MLVCWRYKPPARGISLKRTGGGCQLPGHALSWVVGDERMLVGKLLLRGAMVGHCAAARRGQNCLVHARR